VSAHRYGRIHSETWAGCTVSRTAARQVGPDGIQVQLVPEPTGEGVQRSSRVVAVAVEASVDDGLDAPACGAEQRGDRERGAGDRQVGLVGERVEDDLKQQH